ncbi:MAG: Rrf2 family transcriptional regulator [Dehalococcoidia bacterium]|nr:Rrf2 family transcriptional regulator [Dehalococcoidia bacterium]
MRVSTKGDYGLRALIELSHRNGRGPVQSNDIAAAQDIPVAYLDQLLTTLRRSGFIRSIRGPQGGHVLARDPEDLRLSDVLKALEGSLAPVSWLEDEVCPDRVRAQRVVWQEVHDACMTVLERTTVSDLARRDKEGSVERYSI